MISQTRKILLAAGAAAALAFAAQAAAAADAPDAASLASPKYGTWGFDMSGMDRSVKPGDDFFKFANGKWAERTEIPSDRTRFGNFDKLSVLSENRQHAILEDAAAAPADSRNLRVWEFIGLSRSAKPAAPPGTAL